MIRSAQPIKPKLRRCKECGSQYEKRTMAHVYCSPPCLFAAKKKADEKKARADYKIRKEAVKPRSEHMKAAQIAFNKFVRTRDCLAGHPCISSGRPLDWTGNGVDAGHYRSVGSAPQLRFDERNCHAQSKQDNRYGSGCAVDYRIGLIKRIGIEAVEALEADQAPRKWSIQDLIAIKATYQAKTKALLATAKERPAPAVTGPTVDSIDWSDLVSEIVPETTCAPEVTA